MDRDNRHLRFVLKYYAPGRFDTREALRAYRADHPVRLRLWSRYAAGIAASVAVCIALGYYLSGIGSPSVTQLHAYNEAATFTLPDQSVVTLYPHSSLSYNPDNFGENARNVDMTGKVEFKVTKNPDAPFTATALFGQVRVLGTQFTIDGLDPDSIGVAVTSGKVLFTAKGQTEGAVLTKDMHAYLLADSKRPEVSDDSRETAATGGPHKFVFDNDRLDDVLRQLSDHFNVSLTCDATGKVLTAEFETDNIDEIIMLIEKSLDVKIKKNAK